jgi:hypothetical protein
MPEWQLKWLKQYSFPIVVQYRVRAFRHTIPRTRHLSLASPEYHRLHALGLDDNQSQLRSPRNHSSGAMPQRLTTVKSAAANPLVSPGSALARSLIMDKGTALAKTSQSREGSPVNWCYRITRRAQTPGSQGAVLRKGMCMSTRGDHLPGRPR